MGTTFTKFAKFANLHFLQIKNIDILPCFSSQNSSLESIRFIPSTLVTSVLSHPTEAPVIVIILKEPKTVILLGSS